MALRAITELCEERLAGDHVIEVVDLLTQPARAAADQIAALPCLARVAPGPAKRVVGGLADKAKLAVLLDIG